MVLNVAGAIQKAPLEINLNFPQCRTLCFSALQIVALLAIGRLNAQNLTLEGQTGGFLTPTAYVVESAQGHTFSHPAVGYHFVDTSKVIGNIQTFSVAEGFANRAELGYTRSVHMLGDSNVPAEGAFSQLWNSNGMNIFNGKVVAIKDGQFGALMPGLAAGFVVRTGDKFVSSIVGQELGGSGNAYTNEDLYVAATKTWLHPPLPLLVNLGWKATNASIFGIGGQATRFGGRAFGGLGIPLPGPFKTAIVPSAGFTQEPPTSKNLGAILVGGKAHLPTTLDYAVRVTQREHPHFAFDIGIGQVAGMIGTAELPTGLPAPYPPVVLLPVNLEARHVVGMGISIRP
jgi:hypothetical protein